MNLTPEPPDNIVGINGEIDLEIRRTTRDSALPCGGIHRQVMVDPKARTVTCQACGFVVDAFDYILSWANEGDRRMTALKTIEAQRRIAQTEFDDLQRQIRNMRAQLKRGGMPQSEEEKREYQIQHWNPTMIRAVKDPESTATNP